VDALGAVHYLRHVVVNRDARDHIGQIHAILNHTWSETSHDIAYKNKPRDGFGNKAMEEIINRLNRIMDKYLLPAGYEFQSVQHDYERLQQGKELFDRNILNALDNASNNNERFDLITSPGFKQPAHRNLRVSEGVKNLLR
jgi:ppGpp synthetase/RelA/SpoT-type nucleotidyltranferase